MSLPLRFPLPGGGRKLQASLPDFGAHAGRAPFLPRPGRWARASFPTAQPWVQPWKPWLALNDLTQVGRFPLLPKQPPDEYRLSLGKITDTLRLDYQDFFTRAPDWSIYDPAVVLQLRKPWEQPKQMAGCKQTYVAMVKAIRKFCKAFLHDGTVDCQVCDGRPYGCDLRVHWTCKGVLHIVGEPSMISAISLYTLKHCGEGQDMAEEVPLAWRVHSHIIDVTEIRPFSLRQKLMRSEALYSASC